LIIISSCESWFIKTLSYLLAETKKMWLEDLILKREKSTSTSTFHEIYQPDKLTKKQLSFCKGKKLHRYPHYSVLMSIPLLKDMCCWESPCTSLLHPAFELSLVIEYIYTVYTPTKKIWIFLNRWDYSGAGNGRKSVGLKNSFSWRETEKMKKLNY